jgi:hypothetical protein
MSTDFSLTAGGMITLAYRKLGILPAGGSPTDDQTNQGIILLNIMLKGMQADGINLYRQQQLSLTVPTGVGYAGNPYQIEPLIMGFEEGRWVISQGISQGQPGYYERPLGTYAYVDYMMLPNKGAQSSSGPSIVCFDKQATASNFYFWPLPMFGGTFNCTVARTVDDVNLPTDSMDFPIEWTEGMAYNLADRLMDDEGVAAADQATATRITQRAVAFYEKLTNFDRPTSVFIRPYGRSSSRLYQRTR